MNKIVLSILALVSMGAVTMAVETQTWDHSTQADFEKGTLEKLSLRSDGRLLLAPTTVELLDSSVAALWAVAEDSKGNVYAGGGGPGASSAKLYRITPDGETETVAELEGLGIQALAIDAQDQVFAATSPDGAVYRITAEGEAEVFYSPETKYIWAMGFNHRGELFLATGDRGDIHKVTSDGQGSVFFETEETHVRSLAVDDDDNLIVGTEPGGLIMRISPAGEGFVLYQSSKREITCVLISDDGEIYAAGVGNKTPSTASPVVRPATAVTARPATVQTGAAPPNAPAATTVQPGRPTAVPASRIRPRITGGSELYRLDPDGHPRTLWTHKDEIIYAIALDGGGRPVFGTGNNGKVYRLDSDQLSTMLLKLAPAQVTALRSGRNGKLYAATGNIGKVFAIGPEAAGDGVFESPVLDADHFSYWGRIGFRGTADTGSVMLETRSGNLDRPQQNWSQWAPVTLSSTDGRVTAPPARFLQYRLSLKASAAGASPEITEVNTAYLHKNVAPVVKRVAATPPNYRFSPQVLKLTKTRNLTLQPLGKVSRSLPQPIKSSASQSMQYAKGQIGARWLAEDDNGDALIYRVEVRGVGEVEWKLLEKELERAHLSWDSTAFPDGEYQLRVTASDRPDNPPHQSLEAALEGEVFLVDNTPPQVEELRASRSGKTVTAEWRAVDANTVVTKAEYSVDGGDWMVVEPTTKLSDSKELSFRLELEEVGTGEHTLAVRVTDSFENQAVAKVVVR